MDEWQKRAPGHSVRRRPLFIWLAVAVITSGLTCWLTGSALLAVAFLMAALLIETYRLIGQGLSGGSP